MATPTRPVDGSVFLAAIKTTTDVHGNPIVFPLFVDDSYDPARLIVELPDRALRDLGTISVDGGVSVETGTVYNGSTALTPLFAAIAAAGSGNNTIVSAVASKKIRVLAYNFIAAGTVNAKWQSGASGTDLTGLKYCVANSGICAPFNPVGWFETAAGVLLNLNLSGAVAVGGEVVYVTV